MTQMVPEGLLLHPVDLSLLGAHSFELQCFVLVDDGPLFALGRALDGQVGIVSRLFGVIPHY